MTQDEPSETITGGFLQSNGDHHPIRPRVDARTLTVHEVLPPLEKGAGKGRKTKLAAFGLSPSIIRAGDPDYAKAIHSANKYRKTRMRELASLHGHVSAGAGALLASASLALAASRYLYQKAALDGDSGLLKQASQLADSARSSELAAWEMSAKEGVLKRRQESSDAGMPWLLNRAGETKQRDGRKTNAERQAVLMDVPNRPVLDSGPEVDDAGE